MEPEPVIERSLEVKPIGYTLSLRARPSTIRRTVLRLLPWAVYMALPDGRASRVTYVMARRMSPLAKTALGGEPILTATHRNIIDRLIDFSSGVARRRRRMREFRQALRDAIR